MRNEKKKGFTLIELIATMAVVGILLSAVFSLFSSTNSILISADTDNELQDESRTIVRLIEDDIKFGTKIKLDEVEATPNLEGKKISFERENEEFYYKVKDATKEFQKVKIGSTGEAVLSTISKNVEEFKVRYLDSGVYEISLKLSKNKSIYDYKSSVFPMNS